MTEQIKNSARTVISQGSPMGSGDTSVDVASAAPFPTSGNFRIIIDNEIIVVGSVSSNTFSNLTRGAEGTAAVVHSIGATVTHELTEQSLRNVIAESPASALYLSFNMR